MDFKVTPQGGGYKHMWDVSTVEVYDGGFLLDKNSLPVGMNVIPRGAFLSVDLDERKATIVKTIPLHAAITSAATEVKVKKNSLLKKGDVIGSGDKSITVGDITNNEEYDSFTIEANDLGEVSIETPLQSFSEGKPKQVDGFNYADVKIDAEPSVSVIFKVFKVESERLPYPITDEIVSSLKHCQIL